MTTNRVYPVPVRKPWRVLLEFNDGQHLTGLDDASVVTAWRRMNWLAPLKDPHNDIVQFRQLIIDHARALYREPMFGLTGESTDTEFLDALAAAGVVTVIRK